MRVHRAKSSWIAVASIALAAAAPAPATAEFVAGTTPSVRPEGAPKITAVKHDAGWQARALRGISKPYPKSLGFLKDEGDWFTPFTVPGMTGRYDIRGLHRGRP